MKGRERREIRLLLLESCMLYLISVRKMIPIETKGLGGVGSLDALEADDGTLTLQNKRRFQKGQP